MTMEWLMIERFLIILFECDPFSNPLNTSIRGGTLCKSNLAPYLNGIGRKRSHRHLNKV